MRIHRFFTDIELSQDLSIHLPKAVAHHCIQVLRYKVGNYLILFNGNGNDYLAKLVEIEGRSAVAVVESLNSVNNESKLKVHLYQALAKGDKMDFLIQKCVELGVSEITPIFSERSNVKLDVKRLTKKQQHWTNITISACEQSGRATIPLINSPIDIKKILLPQDEIGLFLDPHAKSKLKEQPISTHVSLFIGPEGGFSNSDIETLSRQNIVGANLGPRVLRTETAGLSSIAVLQSHFGDL